MATPLASGARAQVVVLRKIQRRPAYSTLIQRQTDLQSSLHGLEFTAQVVRDELSVIALQLSTHQQGAQA